MVKMQETRKHVCYIYDFIGGTHVYLNFLALGEHNLCDIFWW